jgi:hypothetical protein
LSFAAFIAESLQKIFFAENQVRFFYIPRKDCIIIRLVVEVYYGIAAHTPKMVMFCNVRIIPSCFSRSFNEMDNAELLISQNYYIGVKLIYQSFLELAQYFQNFFLSAHLFVPPLCHISQRAARHPLPQKNPKETCCQKRNLSFVPGFANI